MQTYYRIHSADEAIETVLDPSRPDGWVASDEGYETQPHGVSCCATLGDLVRYVQHYSLAVYRGDVVLRMYGRDVADDRDQYARRVEVARVEVMGSAEPISRWADRAADPAIDPDRIDSLLAGWAS